MPVKKCKVAGRPGYKYGDSGFCYTYDAGNEKQMNEAKRKAHLQRSAIEANTDEDFESEEGGEGGGE